MKKTTAVKTVEVFTFRSVNIGQIFSFILGPPNETWIKVSARKAKRVGLSVMKSDVEPKALITKETVTVSII